MIRGDTFSYSFCEHIYRASEGGGLPEIVDGDALARLVVVVCEL